MKKTADISLLSPEQRKTAISSIIDYFANERDEQIGIIAAEGILDMFLDQVGPHLFNQGVRQTKKLVEQHFQEIDFDIELLMKDK